jgi:hypothetical protein
MTVRNTEVAAPRRVQGLRSPHVFSVKPVSNLQQLTSRILQSCGSCASFAAAMIFSGHHAARRVPESPGPRTCALLDTNSNWDSGHLGSLQDSFNQSPRWFS